MVLKSIYSAVVILFAGAIAIACTNHISASDSVSVTHNGKVLVDKLRNFTYSLYAVNLLGRSICISAVDNYCSAVEKTLKKRESYLFIGNLVKIDFILCNIEEAYPCYELCFGKIVACK